MSSLETTDFEWPSVKETREIQERALAVLHKAPNYTKDAVKLVWVDAQGRTWIPDSAVDLQQRLCVIAHAGAEGHLGDATTYDILAKNVVWKSMKVDVHKFVNKCLQCLVVHEHDINEQPKAHIQNLQQTIDALDKQVSETAKKKNEAARQRHEQKHGVHAVNFEIGDFVLSGNVTRRGNKLILHGKGPYRVVATINGWTINMDGTFMKHSSGGTLLVACLRNSNNDIQIVAVAWVSGETKENWSWFLDHLLKTITRPAFIISDRDKGLIPALKQAVEGMEAVDKKKWAAAYSPCAHFGTMTSNNVESVNSALMAAREEPLLDCLMTIEKYLIGKWVEFIGKVTKCGQLTDYAEKTFVGKRLARGFDGMEVFSQSSSSFSVKVKRDGQLLTEYAIERDKASDPCSCGYFQYMDAPCIHVVTSLKHINNVSILGEFIGTSWTTAVYKQAYNPLFKMTPTDRRMSSSASSIISRRQSHRSETFD
nr:transposon protein putative [Albugo laibachii Nc14]|eukprot:CCA27099.1 transposon protein putative [Albugo laibachii Nc14]